MKMTDQQRKTLEGKQVIANISGGKDSAALSLWLTENGIEHRRIFADTGWEAPETYDYLRGELQDTIGEIEWVRARHQMVERIRHYGSIPSRRFKWCTKELKIQPLFDRLLDLQAEGDPVLSCVGIRWDESSRRAAMDEWDAAIHRKQEIEIWRPILSWTDQDVIDIHHRHGLKPNPLYVAGAMRVGCWPCIYSRKSEIRMIAERTPERIDLIEMLEGEVQAAMLKRDPERAGPFGFFFQHKFNAPDEDYSIRKVVEWSKTSRGGRQFELFEPDPDAGCMRWGMCEHPKEGGE
jgi:3'-phosphoadenosine 5'-phosphosulfate sulfotransferase (PAPS reductase)/FAD synthetase